MCKGVTNKLNKNSLPKEALYCIRYHSLYLHHQDEAYDIFLDKRDKEMLGMLREFRGYDLYTKGGEIYDVREKGKEYYELWLKYFEKNGLFL